MSIHLPVTGGEAADRLAIRELVDAYAHCADRRLRGLGGGVGFDHGGAEGRGEAGNGLR